jgi:lysophospholipase
MAIATQDTIVSPRAIEALALELRAGSQVMIPGARHEILMERDAFREQFWAAFDTFVPERS